MFAVLYRVATNIGVIDTEDGCIEMLTPQQLQSYINQGIQIAGVSSTGIKPFNVTLPMNLCNWNRGKNIFDTAQEISIEGDHFILWVSGRKPFKGIIQTNPGSPWVILNFSINVSVQVPTTWIQSHLAN